jgi:hypothetical protein
MGKSLLSVYQQPNSFITDISYNAIQAISSGAYVPFQQKLTVWLNVTSTSVVMGNSILQPPQPTIGSISPISTAGKTYNIMVSNLFSDATHISQSGSVSNLKITRE